MNDGLGKDAEHKIREWLDRPEDGYSFDRIPDQMSGMYMTSRNVCDFICYHYPYQYYIESKATWGSRWDLSTLLPNQYDGLLKKSKIAGCYGWVIVLFASYKRAFKFDIRDIEKLKLKDIKSLNISKIADWPIEYKELKTIPNNRKKLLDYTGELEDLM